MAHENDLFKRIKRLEQDTIAYKSPQPVGTSSVLAYTTQTNNLWDVDFNLGSIDSSTSTTFLVKWHARNQKAPFGKLRFFAQANGQPANYAASDNITANNDHVFYVYDDIFLGTAADFADPQLLRFRLDVNGVSGTNIKIKFIVDATDSGYFNLYVVTGGQPVEIKL